MVANDECLSEEGCALSALQRRQRVHTAPVREDDRSREPPPWQQGRPELQRATLMGRYVRSSSFRSESCANSGIQVWVVWGVSRLPLRGPRQSAVRPGL